MVEGAEMTGSRSPVRVTLSQAEASILQGVAASILDDPDRDMRDLGYTGAQRNALRRALDKLALARAGAELRDSARAAARSSAH
jgi:hypothetical protein